MIKKSIFILFLFFTFSFLFLFVPDGVFAEVCFDANSSICRSSLGSPPNRCCTSSSCLSVCGPLQKWEYCHILECCVKSVNEYDFYWKWTRIKCSVADSCNGSIYLQPGLCLSSGCAKGRVGRS